jgi:hypothetical protein
MRPPVRSQTFAVFAQAPYCGKTHRCLVVDLLPMPRDKRIKGPNAQTRPAIPLISM